MNKLITKELLEKYLQGKCTIAECELVEQWYASFDNDLPLIEDELSKEALELKYSTKDTISEIIAESNRYLNEVTNKEDQNIIEIGANRNYYSFTKVAAAVLVVLSASICLLLINKPNHTQTVKAIKPVENHKNDINPGSNLAVLTLADGSTITLDSAGSGALVMQGNTSVIKQSDGRLVYNTNQLPGSGSQQQVTYNTLSTPRAAQYEVILPDGTRAWLNAASSIRYPTAFIGEERIVEITGEVYFEVAKVPAHQTINGSVTSKAMTFRVKVKDMDVVVLGTHFNVNAYDEEQTINTTLLEGSVKVLKGNKQVLIKPGEQARLNTAGSFKVENANVNEVVAWKNGLFQFENATINTVMRQISRWYDVEVIYQRDVSADRFQGKLYRNTEITQLLKILEYSGAQFKIEGKKIIVQ